MYAWSRGRIRTGIDMAAGCFHASDRRFWLLGLEDVHAVYIDEE